MQEGGGEMVELERSRFDAPEALPTNPQEVELIKRMQFDAQAMVDAPTDLFKHPDGTTGPKIRPQYLETVQHSASSSFFCIFLLHSGKWLYLQPIWNC